jgi:hypothetical protein
VVMMLFFVVANSVNMTLSVGFLINFKNYYLKGFVSRIMT